MDPTPLEFSRRQFLRAGFAGISCFLGSSILGCDHRGPDPDKLLGPDSNGVRLLPGYSSRIVARSGQVPNIAGAYPWHDAPDGGAVFDAGSGDWIYVSNSEISGGLGGVGAIRFDQSGFVEDAYSICSGTSRNCAGGRTPWNTWLTCEEIGDAGLVFECDPTGVAPAAARPALGSFNHEAVAVDTINGHLYLTEDRPDGGLYRFIPTNPFPDLSAGTLEIAEVSGGSLVWYPVPDPTGTTLPTRYQVPQTTPFNGGEGIAFQSGVIYFTTKGDNRVWSLDVTTQMLTILYDDDTSLNPILTGVDNLTLTANGDVLVAEDGGDLQIVAVRTSGAIEPICQLVGHDASEIAGPAFTPDYSRLYFSSQRGTSGLSSGGMTFEIQGPFV